MLRREYSCQPVVGVGAVIVDCGRLVLVRRGAEPALGKWSFPGGAVKLGETIRDAAIRETKEEGGLDVELVEDTPLLPEREDALLHLREVQLLHLFEHDISPPLVSCRRGPTASSES